MGSTQRKYEKAWDNKLKTWVKPEEVGRAEAHDRNRYFSEKFEDSEDKGSVLTLHKESKSFKSKNGKDIKRKSHFCAIAENTRAYREETAKKLVRQESIVHKLCKEVIKEIEFIKVPEVNANIMGIEYPILREQLIEIKFKNTEKMDNNTGRIPDAIVEANILGSNQTLFIEFLYAHEVTEQKRREYEYYRINCLEVDISHLRDNLEESEKSLRNKIKNIIENNCYWISNSVKLFAENEALQEYVIEIKKSNGLLRDTEYYHREKCSDEVEWLSSRMYVFKDNLRVEPNHPCYFVEKPNTEYVLSEKCTNIGECAKCNNCVWIYGYTAKDSSNTSIYCKKTGDKKRVNPFELVNNIINKAIEFATNNTL